MAPRTYQIEAAFLRPHGEAIDMLWLEVARNSCPNPGSDLLVRGCHIGHPARLEVLR
jgi:hypothetical protein